MTLAFRAAAAAIAAAIAFPAWALETLNVIVFPGGFNWPLWIANEKGIFAKHGLEVKIAPTPGSVYQVTNLMAGKFDIGISTLDNVVAYDEGQGEAALPEPPDLFAFMGGQTGAVRLVVRPDVRSFADLKGRSLAVDARTTGYAFVMRKMLALGGLGAGDYTMQPLGSTAARAEALMQGRTDGTILTSPLEILPETKGFRRLANATEMIGPYQAVLGIARRSWARSHEEALVAYIRSYVEALDWLSDRAHIEEAVAIYRKNVPNASEEGARKAWEVLVSEGFAKKGKIDLEGARTVLKLRSEYGEPRKMLDDPSRYIDESYYRKALE
ncbi:MAG: ABC transporter substrate-binding protein [Bacillota bacterium]